MKHINDYKTFEGKGPKGKDLTVFVRFGGVNLKPQKGYKKSSETFHSPPAPRGFYAFPKIAQELFLVGSMDSFQPSTMPKYKNSPQHPGDDAPKEEIEKWEKEMDAYDFDTVNPDYEKRRRNALSSMRKEFKRTDGNIWSHLGEYVKRSEIIAEHGSWVKTTIKEWQRAFNKMSLKHRMPNDSQLGTNNINTARGIMGYFSQDHCEVFFDEKV
jgi:hypothetical protein